MLLPLLISLTALKLQPPPVPANRPVPTIWMFPAPWEGNGRCLREMIDHPEQWKQTRSRVSGLGYWPTLLNVHFSDAEIRRLFKLLKQWDLPFGLEVQVIKREWPTARESFDMLQDHMKRFIPLGMKVSRFSMDEPLYGATRMCGKSGDYAVEETARYLEELNRTYPGVPVTAIEPYPAIPLKELTGFFEALQARCKARGVPGIDMVRMDVDWVGMNNWMEGSWKDMKTLELWCRERGIKFSMICWSADWDFLKEKKVDSPMSWYTGVLHTASTYTMFGGAPDDWTVESWQHTPPHAVPETDRTAFTASVLEIARIYGGPARKPKPARR